MADASSSSGGLLGLPSCVLSSICNQLQAAEQGALRQVCSGLSCTVDSVLQSVSCSADIQQLSTLLAKLKGLKHLTVEGIGCPACGASPCTLSPHAYMWLVLRSSGTQSCYAGLHYHAPDLVASLSALTALTSITLTSAAAAQLGALKWAVELEAESAVAGSTGANTHGSSQQESSPLPSALDDFFWVPDWLASAPKLQQLAIQAPDVSPQRSNRRGSSRPVWLWLHAPAWADKLTCLQLKGVPLPSSTAPPPIQGLTCLQRLVLTGTQLTRAAVKRLLWQLTSCQQLTALDLSANDLSCLPEQGWEGVVALRDLDVSRQKLLELPPGLSHLTALTALRVHHNALTTLCKELFSLSSLQHLAASHNWLSGGGPCLPRLLEAWPHLTGLELDNVSDKRGRLVLPHQLAACKHLQEVSIKDNFNLDWASVLAVLPNCKALRVVRLDKHTPSADVKELQAVLSADWAIVSLD